MDTPQEKTPDTAWERKTLEKLLFAAYEEQKSRRRWSIFFRTAILLFLFLILLASVEFGKDADTHVRHTAMIDLQGVIQPKGESNAENIIAALTDEDIVPAHAGQAVVGDQAG